MLASKHEASDQGAFPRGLAVEVYRLWGFLSSSFKLKALGWHRRCKAEVGAWAMTVAPRFRLQSLTIASLVQARAQVSCL